MGERSGCTINVVRVDIELRCVMESKYLPVGMDLSCIEHLN